MADYSDTLEKLAAHHVEDTLGQGALVDAKQASDEEHSQTLWQAISANRKAVVWSVLISLSIIMEGYDVILIGNFFGYPQFAEKYGHDYGGSIGWQVSTPWQTALSMAAAVGTVIGGMINGYLCSRFGYRWVMIGALVVLNGLIFIIVFAPSLAVLVVGQILCGLPWGVFAIVGPTYASEVCPTNLRAYLATYVNLCWTIGQFIAAGVLEGFIGRQDEWAFRIPFALQWALPLPLIVICYFAPESPWYLVRKDRLDDAKVSLRRLAGNKTDDQINGQLAMLVHTAKIEAQLERGTTYWDCFKGVDLRRTEIICVSFLGQILSGSSFAYQPTYFFTTAGMSSDRAYQLNVGGTAVAFVGTALSWWLIGNMGRRTIYLMGQGVLCTTLFLIGILNASSKTPGSLWVQAAFCIFWLFFYSFTIGPVAWAIMSETSSVRLRPLSVALGRTSYQLMNVVSQILEPYFMNPLAWNASGKTGFFWGGTALVMFVWAFFRLPEPRGRTYEELDILFAKKVPARKFASAHVDAYAQGEDQVAVKEKH